jgi:zinc protease
MKKIFSFIVLIALLHMHPASAAIPSVKEITTTGGFKPWVVEDHYLPIVSLKIAFTNSGTAYDPKEKPGLAYMTSSLLDEGAGGMSSLDFRKKLEELATDISFQVDEDNFYISLKTLTTNLPESLRLLNLAITKPNFDNQAIERIRGQILISLAKSEEDPEYLAARKFKQEVFINHPYSNPKLGTKEAISKITKEDLIAFVNGHFTAKNAMISIVGDVDSKLPSLLDNSLQLSDKQPQINTLPAVTISDKGHTIYIDKQIPQSVVTFGMRGLKRSDKDFYPAYVLNHILGGGGFESRLMNEVREKNGLAYTIYTYLDLMQQAGLLVGYVATENSKVEKSISLIKKELNDISKNGVSETELQDAKDYLINSFPLKMSKNSDIADFLTVMQTESLGIDFMQKRDSYVKNITLSDINAEAKRLLNSDNLIFIVVGKRK